MQHAAAMPVEFALRPRIHLREPVASRRRSRFRLPKFLLPAAAYWLVAAGLTAAFVRAHTAAAAAPLTEAAAVAAAEPPSPNRPWWQLAPATAPLASVEARPVGEPEFPRHSDFERERVPELEAEPAPEPALEPVPKPERALGSRSEATRRSPLAREETPEPKPEPKRESNSPPRPEPGARDAALSPEPPSESTRPPSPTPVRGAFALPSCEAALNSSNQDVDFSRGNGTADLPSAAIAAVLENGAWFSSCNAPASTSLDVCVAIRGGSVVGVSITSRPSDSALDSCLKRRAAALQFPYSSHLDIARTRF